MNPSFRVYPSAVDRWLILVMYAGPMLLTAVGFYCIWQERFEEATACIAFSVGLVLLNLFLTRPCRYTLTSDSLNVRCGIINRKIGLEQIRGAELTASWKSAPALSLRRVRILLDKGDCLVSPTEREKFISDLLAAVASRPPGGDISPAKLDKGPPL